MLDSIISFMDFCFVFVFALQIHFVPPKNVLQHKGNEEVD